MDIKQDLRIKLESEEPLDITLSEQLADRFALPSPSLHVDAVPYCFVYKNAQLHLYIRHEGRQLGPLTVDFLSGPVFYRYLKDRRINQPLARAMGIKQGVRPSVCDVTAGLGGDSFVLAALGCRVTMIERSPLIGALLQDGIIRTAAHAEIGRIFRQRVSLHLDDAISFFGYSTQVFDTIYMDPMYPPQKKSALNKQEMRLIRHVVGNDEDSRLLLKEARARAHIRVVVKRPAGSPCLEEPSYSVKGKSSRFDVYLSTYL